MGAREINFRLDIKWLGLHTVTTIRKNRKILNRIKNINKFTTKHPGRSWRNLQSAFSTHCYVSH